MHISLIGKMLAHLIQMIYACASSQAYSNKYSYRKSSHISSFFHDRKFVLKWTVQIRFDIIFFFFYHFAPNVICWISHCEIFKINNKFQLKIINTFFILQSILEDFLFYFLKAFTPQLIWCTHLKIINDYTIIIIVAIIVSVSFHTSSNWWHLLSFEWKQIFSASQDFPEYSSKSQQLCGLDGLNPFS